MAALPRGLSDVGRTSSSETRNKSHGRGGAGNMGTSTSDFDRPSLDTPTLKSEVYTTGRGGSGNMARNDDPEAARRAQDVVAHPRRESNKDTHVGRGGAANIFSAEEKARIAAANGGSAVDSGKSEKGWADRSKDWLLNKK